MTENWMLPTRQSMHNTLSWVSNRVDCLGYIFIRIIYILVIFNAGFCDIWFVQNNNIFLKFMILLWSQINICTYIHAFMHTCLQQCVLTKHGRISHCPPYAYNAGFVTTEVLETSGAHGKHQKKSQCPLCIYQLEFFLCCPFRYDNPQSTVLAAPVSVCLSLTSL